MTQTPAPRSARARARAELTREIKNVARRQLGEVGSAGLSLRAVARELGMVSSALYRYFPSRDELLTALIIDAYSAAGQAGASADAAMRRTDHLGRWLAVTRAVRHWAKERPQEYALIFGSPVPGYAAPEQTIEPAAQIPLLLIGVINDACAAGKRPPARNRPIPRPVRSDLAALARQIAPNMDEGQLGRAVMAWTQLIGAISFELFGHLHNVIFDFDAYFDYQMRELAADVGLR